MSSFYNLIHKWNIDNSTSVVQVAAYQNHHYDITVPIFVFLVESKMINFHFYPSTDHS